MASKFTRLGRFKDSSGKIFYGEVGKETLAAKQLVGKTVPTYAGNTPWDDDFALNGKEMKIAEVLSPIPSAPIIYGIGLNYGAHVKEAQEHGVKPQSDKHPIAFTKPPDALAGPLEDVLFNEVLQDLDYEGELTVVIGKTCKNLQEGDDLTPYILGYTAGNDVSSRHWQRPPQSGGQHAIGKSFDKFAPIGPVIASTTAIPDPHALELRTFVNGEQRQQTSTGDMIFNIAAIIRFLSRGVTLRPGTVIMTGTPAGVAASFNDPDKYLKDGDVVEVEISGIGRIKNKMVHEDW